MKIDHIAIAVKDIDEAINKWSIFIKERPTVKIVESEGVKLFFVEGEGTKIEIISPLDELSPISNFLKKRGEGLHHICIQVEDFDKFKKEIEKRNIQIVKEGTGYDGRRILFCHPSSFNSVLLEVKEASKNK